MFSLSFVCRSILFVCRLFDGQFVNEFFEILVMYGESMRCVRRLFDVQFVICLSDF